MIFMANGFASAQDYQGDAAGNGGRRVASPGAKPARGATFIACGEYARRAGRRMQAIVGAIDGVWGGNVRVYESVAVAPPHALPGGCVMYNPAYLNILWRELLIRDRGIVEPMLYAIMAHEVGHELHADFSSQRAQVPKVTKELEADRFAGYTLERLNIGLDNITPYYSLAGDEFAGGRSSHGDSMRRTTALKKGWELGEWNQPEGYQSLSDGD
jgi:hypothetical protein